MAIVYWLESGRVDQVMKYTARYGLLYRGIIKDVFENEAATLIENHIYRLMPKSTVKPWKGKRPHAKESKSLRHRGDDIYGTPAIVVTTHKHYQYLYFPDDGTSTRKHIGNQEFFYRGAVAASPEITERCVRRLVEAFEQPN